MPPVIAEVVAFPELEYDGELLTDRSQIADQLPEHCLTPNGLPFAIDQAAIKQASDAKAMTADFVMVTRSTKPNRHGNIVEIMQNDFGQGMQLEYFQSNPVCLLNHGFGFALPIGAW